MLAQTLKADEARELGILSVLAEEGKLAEETKKLTDKLANSPTTAIGYQKRMINLIQYRDMKLMREFEMNFMPACSATADHAEAVNAFLEKRSPKFTGK